MPDAPPRPARHRGRPHPAPRPGPSPAAAAPAPISGADLPDDLAPRRSLAGQVAAGGHDQGRLPVLAAGDETKRPVLPRRSSTSARRAPGPRRDSAGRRRSCLPPPARRPARQRHPGGRRRRAWRAWRHARRRGRGQERLDPRRHLLFGTPSSWVVVSRARRAGSSASRAASRSRPRSAAGRRQCSIRR